MKIICIGRNYVAHARELNNPLPENPIFFLKPDSALLKNNKPFFLPPFSNDLHHEVELVVKINKLGKGISTEFANRYYGEVTLGIDFTARDLQILCKEKGLPWEIAKAFDNSAALGKFLPLSELGNIQDLSFSLEINDTIVQDGKTNLMIFPVDELIAYVSRFMTLKTGDLLYTGTPAGVGPVKKGDHLKAYLEGILILDFYIR